MTILGPVPWQSLIRPQSSGPSLLTMSLAQYQIQHTIHNHSGEHLLQTAFYFLVCPVESHLTKLLRIFQAKSKMIIYRQKLINLWYRSVNIGGFPLSSSKTVIKMWSIYPFESIKINNFLFYIELRLKFDIN